MLLKNIYIFFFIGLIKLYGQENIWYGPDTLLIPTEKAPQKYFCFVSKKNCLIKSNQDLKEYIFKNNPPSNKGKYAECNSVSLDSFDIDFNKKNIIFLRLSNNTCSNNYTLITFHLFKLLKEKKYLLLVNAKGYCEDKVGRYISFREIIPKIEDGYVFECKIIEK